MAQLQITIDLGNAAVEVSRNDHTREEGEILEHAEVEVDRILTIIAERFIEACEYGKWLNAYDINGNPVGKFKVDLEAKPSFD